MSTAVGRRNPAVRQIVAEDRISLYNPATDRMVLLNSTASEIWMLSDGASAKQVAERLAQAHGVDTSTIIPDVEKTLSTLRYGGFLLTSTTGRSPRHMVT